MVNGQKKFLIPILKEPLDIDSLPKDMQMYLRTYTYIDGINYKKDLHRLEKGFLWRKLLTLDFFVV